MKAEVESKVKVSVDKFDKAKVDRGVEQREGGGAVWSGAEGGGGGVALVHVPGMLMLCDVTHAPHCGN